LTDNVIIAGMGLTLRMREALKAITEHVALHGVMPSRRVLAERLGCNATNASRLIHSLVERGELSSLTPGGPLSGFGHQGVAVMVPAHVAASLAAFCLAQGERLTSVTADAIALHIDQLSEGVAEAGDEIAGEALS
jgi:SOS-response transcriptional repressor LexA